MRNLSRVSYARYLPVTQVPLLARLMGDGGGGEFIIRLEVTPDILVRFYLFPTAYKHTG
eukprot:UN15571